MNSNGEVWVVDDDQSIRWVLERSLSQVGMAVEGFDSAKSLLERLRGAQPDVIVTDVRMPGTNGIELLHQIVDGYPGLPVIIMTAYSDLESTVTAFQGGAFEYLAKPFDIDEAAALVSRAIAHRHEQQTTGLIDSVPQEQEIIGSAPSMQEVFRAIGRLSRSNITVLITGESGTGKELVARALHRHSPRANGPFIALNTAAIPADLLESELFGHERGAFTGAQSLRQGRFEQAHGGTLFLDEIGDMPADLQTRLLRVLADGEFYRVGGHTPIRVDVRIIAATHQALEENVRSGSFREDLFHRLNVIRVQLPALRERREDIAALLEYFLNAAAGELEVERKILRPEVEKHLGSLEWPGNVRQLENACRWLTVMGSGREIFMSDLPPELLSNSSMAPASKVTSINANTTFEDGLVDQASSSVHAIEANGASGVDLGSARWEVQLRGWAEVQLRQGSVRLLDGALPAFEKIMIEAALQHSGGHRQEAARLLGWGRNTLTRKIKELRMFEDSESKRAPS